MKTELELRRKMTVRSGDRKLVVHKSALERIEHVLMKVFIWHLYLPKYPDAIIDHRIGDRYRPDVVALDRDRRPIFWGEAGMVSTGKIGSLLRRFPDTHLVIGKWEARIEPWVEIVRQLLEKRKNRSAPVDLNRFPDSVAYGGIDASGRITLRFADVECIRVGGPGNNGIGSNGIGNNGSANNGFV